MVDIDESQLSPGKLLLQGRLQTGLTQEQVAKELYMTLSKVKALESDDYSRLNSDTFARGYIRAYANLIKLDVVNILAVYDRQARDVKTQATASHVIPVVENSHRGTWQFLAFIGAFFIGLWLISVWFFDNHVETDYVLPASNLSSLSEGIDNLPATTSQAFHSESVVNVEAGQATSAPTIVALGQSQHSSTKADVQAARSSSAISLAKPLVSANDTGAVTSSIGPVTHVENMRANELAADQKMEDVAKKNALDEITFSFRAESWLEVSDSRGDVLATELQAAGSARRLFGKAPFDVKLGNAPAVDIQLNGKKIDVIPLMGSNVLTLKVSD